MAKLVGASKAAKAPQTHMKAQRLLDRLLMAWIFFV
jgi:hypothetical protein